MMHEYLDVMHTFMFVPLMPSCINAIYDILYVYQCVPIMLSAVTRN